ncbi:MAG: dephospho-CoA kinase [Verrucomicrobiota bacterium]
MPVVGITGGIATGKSSFCDCLREIFPQAEFFNADHAARQLVDLDPQVQTELRREFGGETFSESGELNRAKLRAIVFADATRKRALEQILHPRIRQQWSAASRRNSTELFFADIPLLYETGGETLCERVVVVACSEQIQMKRLMARSKLEQSVAQQIIRAQMPLAEKIQRADHVVWNNGDRAVLETQARLLAKVFTQ